MAKYLVFASYSAEGVKGFQTEKGSGRRDAVRKALTAVGAKLDQFYFTFGDHDVAMVVDAPDNTSMMAISLSAAVSGTCRMSTMPLITAEEADAAIDKHMAYPGPHK